MFRLAGKVRVSPIFAGSLRVRSSLITASPSQRQQQHTSAKLAKACYVVRTFSSNSTGTWNWNNFAASDKKDNIEGGSKDSQESQVLKKTAELYMSLMPLNKKVGTFLAERKRFLFDEYKPKHRDSRHVSLITRCTFYHLNFNVPLLLSETALMLEFLMPILGYNNSYVVHWNSSSKLQMVSKVP